MKHFVFFTPASDPDEGKSWALALKAATLREVRDHMNDRKLYPDPTVWKFMVIKGRELPVDFQAVVKF